MVCTTTPSSSSAWKKSVTFEGASKFADPSASTGTVPNTHLPGSSRVKPISGAFMFGCVLGGTATMRSRFTTAPFGMGLRPL
jgi:hypothetical protein